MRWFAETKGWNERSKPNSLPECKSGIYLQRYPDRLLDPAALQVADASLVMASLDAMNTKANELFLFMHIVLR
jgi:hypothetical protein